MRPVGRVSNLGNTFDATAMARIGWGRGIPQGLSGWFDDLVAHFGGVAKSEGTTWLLEQYTALRQLPARIARLTALARRVADKVGLAAPNANADVARLLQAGQSLENVQAGYPAMIALVEQAYRGVSGATQTSDVTLSLAGTVAAAVYQARNATDTVDDAEAEMRAAVDHLIQTGVLTEQDAQTLAAGSGGASTLLMVGGGLVGLYFLAKALR